MVFSCMLSKAINLQVVEGHSAVMLAQGLSRMGCEVGLPARLLIDQDSSFMKVLLKGQVDLVDLETQMRKRATMDFQLCPVAGHNHHGQVEARIRTVQDAMDKMGIYQERLHATGLQTTLKLIESDMNSTPLGVTMGRSSCNTPMLKLIAPDHLRLGRISNRIPAGPFKLPDSPQDMITRVDELYWRWHQIFNDTMLPALLITDQPKWFNHDTDLKVDDVVYFNKTTGALRSPWALGLVHEVDIGRDGLIRMVTVRYFNSTEPSKPQYTDRAVRSLVRLFHIDELSWAKDMDRVRYICQKFNLPLAPDTQPPASPNMNCGCCHGSHLWLTSLSTIACPPTRLLTAYPSLSPRPPTTC